MRKIFFLLLIGAHVAAVGQPGGIKGSSAPQQISYGVLPDSGYTFQQILAGKNLLFVADDSLHLEKYNACWLKISITNPAHYSGYYRLEIDPSDYNTFYYYDGNLRQWRTQNTGLLAGVKSERESDGVSHMLMQPFITNTVYVKLNTAGLKKAGFAVRPQVLFRLQDAEDKAEENMRLGWAASIMVLFFFFLSNIYLYTGFRDKPVLYYLIAQVGAMLYITGYRQLLPSKIFTYTLLRDGTVHYYSFNSLVMHIGILLILHGFVQLTREYLSTQKHLPSMDALLQYGLYFYWAAIAVLTPVNLSWFLVEDYTVVGENIYIFLLISLIVCTCILAYKRRLPAAGTFLLANVLPLTIIIAVTLFHVFVSLREGENWWLPNLGLVSAAFVFSIALVARTKLIEKHLAAKEMEARELAFELSKIALRQESLELENQKISISIENEKNRNGFLQQKLEINQRELASTTLYMLQKNELLARLKSEIGELNSISPDKQRRELSGIKSILRSNLYLDDDWAKFKMHFEQVHPNFFESLLATHPNLTKNDIRLYAYFHINLSTKEIATLLNITPASVRQAKMRLYRKIGQPDLPSPEDSDE